MLFQSRGILHAWARVPLRFYSRSVPLKRMRHPRQPDAGSMKFRPTASPSSEERLDLNPTWSEFNRGRNKRFVDQARIRVRGGHGGSGCNSFEMFSDAWRRPSGGHGGGGGDVVIIADPKVKTLLFDTHHFNAPRGGNGGSSNLKGRAGATLEVRVPCGTLVRRIGRKDAYEEQARDLEKAKNDEKIGKGSGFKHGKTRRREIRAAQQASMAARAAAAERRAFRAGSSEDPSNVNVGSALFNQDNEVDDEESSELGKEDEIDDSYDDADDDEEEEEEEEEVEVVDHELVDGTIVLLDEADGSVYDAVTFEALGKLDKETNTVVPDDSDEGAGEDSLNDDATTLRYDEDDAIYDTETSVASGELKKGRNTTFAAGDEEEDGEIDNDDNDEDEEEEEEEEDAVIHTLADGTVVFLDQVSGIIYDVDSFEALGTLDEEANEIVELGEYDYFDDEYGTWEGEVDDWDYSEDNDEDEFVVLEEVDLVQPGESYVAAKGGRPGMGNCMLAGKTHNDRASSRAHRSAGHAGTEAFFELELKAIAEVGLVGYPNAGKSSFLAATSNARPHVAPYPFTTLAPGLGVLEYSDYVRVTVADLPGLVDGASQNRGLGHSFLRHVERVYGIAFVVDAAGVDGRDPCADLRSLLDELLLYQPALARKPAVLLANKCDLPGAEHHLPRLRQLVKELAAESQLEAEIAAEEEEDSASMSKKAIEEGEEHNVGVAPKWGIQAMYETSMVSGGGLREAVIGIRACIVEPKLK